MSAYTKRGVLGAFFGAILGVWSAQWAVIEYGGRLADQPILALAGVGITIGGVGGVVFEWLGGLRKRGRLGYLLSWTFSSGVGGIIVEAPEALANRSWIDVAFVVGLCLVGGLGLGLFAEELRRRT